MIPGFRLRSVEARVDATLCARASALPAAVVGDAMWRMQSMRGGFRAYGGRLIVAGPAFPVRVRTGDNLALHRAIDLAEPGDVIVCDAGGALEVAITGGLMLSHAAVRGVGAVIIDGAIRDAAELGELPIGVWARGIIPAGPTKDGPGEIGFPIACGGLVVAPGDLILADEDGVVVVPLADAAAVLEAAEAIAAREAVATTAIAAGTWDRAWVDAALRARGAAGL